VFGVTSPESDRAIMGSELPAARSASQPDRFRFASLDGWRALSVLLVLGGHSERVYHGPEKWKAVFPWFEGALGVLFFFVISGFLITWLLMVENERSGHVSLKNFYIRRALRILPVFFAFLFAVGLLQYFTPYSQSWAEWLGNITFTQNFVGSPHTTGHLWSLSVEEQFYLAWPLLFIYLSKRGMNSRRTILLLMLPIFVAPLCRALGHVSQPAFLAPIFRGRSFFSYFDCLAVGCACAFAFHEIQRRPAAFNPFVALPGWTFSIGSVLVIVPYVLEKFHQYHPVLQVARVTVLSTSEAIGFGVLMLQSVFLPRWGIYRVLNWRWVCQLGVMSYSIYIWQQLFCTEPEVFGLGRVWWMTFPGWLVPVFVVAAISYHGFERPILRLRGRFRKGSV
jgi:peptidoglycan/LPS O-acetylase OafA/YrhL